MSLGYLWKQSWPERAVSADPIVTPSLELLRSRRALSSQKSLPSLPYPSPTSGSGGILPFSGRASLPSTDTLSNLLLGETLQAGQGSQLQLSLYTCGFHPTLDTRNVCAVETALWWAQAVLGPQLSYIL